MDEQQSQKRGVRSEAQKEEKARDSYAPIPPANPVGGAFGERKRDTPTDEEMSLAVNTKRQQQIHKRLEGGRNMAKYGKKASEKVEKAMHERKEGTLKSGRSGTEVTNKKQAIAIGLSQARKEGAKVPRKNSSSKKK